jgi:hypothetical protein
VAVVLGGDLLSIEYRNGGDPITVQITAGQVEWEELNIGKRLYEQVTVFLLDSPDAVAHPSEE